ERLARGVARVGQSILALEGAREPIEGLGRVGATTSGQVGVGATAERRDVVRRASERKIEGRDRVVRPAEPRQRATEADVRRWAVRRDLAGLAVCRGGLVELLVLDGDVPELEVLAILLGARIAHAASPPPRSSTSRAFWTWSRFSD